MHPSRAQMLKNVLDNTQLGKRTFGSITIGSVWFEKDKLLPNSWGRCGKPEAEIETKSDTFFLAEPFKPDQERKRRERAVKTALKEAIEKFREENLIVADKEPKDPAIFCDICRLIQCSSYGIVDISGLNPNALLELGMLVAFGKPIFVLAKESEEKSLREKLPSDIVWKRVIPYDEFIDIEEELAKQVKNRPKVEIEHSLVEECAKMFAELDADLAKAIDTKLKVAKKEQAERLRNLGRLMRKAKLSDTISSEKEAEIPHALEKKIGGLYDKIEQIEKLIGFPRDAKIASMRGNWHYHRMEYDRALELYDWAVILKPDYHEAWFNKGVTLGKLGKYEDEITCYDKIIELKPDYKEAQLARSKLSVQKH